VAIFVVGDRIRLITRHPRDDLSPDWVGKVGAISHVHAKSYAFPGVVPDPAQAYEVDFDGKGLRNLIVGAVYMGSHDQRHSVLRNGLLQARHKQCSSVYCTIYRVGKLLNGIVPLVDRPTTRATMAASQRHCS